MVDRSDEKDNSFEFALGEAVWKACEGGKRDDIQGWILRHRLMETDNNILNENNGIENLDCLELPKFETMQHDINTNKIIYSYLNYLRFSFKSGYKDPTPRVETQQISHEKSPVIAEAIQKRDKSGKRRVTPLTVQTPRTTTAAWTTQDFPPLGASTKRNTTTVATQLDGKKQPKDKRRIRSTLLSTVPLERSFTSTSSNMVVPLEKDVLDKFETRLIAPSPTIDTKSKPVDIVVPKPKENQGVETDPLEEEELTSELTTYEEIDHTPTQNALLYIFLLSERNAPSTNTEIQWLFSLLCKDERNAQQFAVSVINNISGLILAYGADIVKLVIETFQKARIKSPVVNRFTSFLDQYEETRATESQLAGTPLPVESEVLMSNRNFAVPFREDTDSRLHFRTPQETVLYSNREKARDAFLALLRSWQSAQTSMGNRRDSVQSANVMTDLLPGNQWWFAQFFVMELLQVGINPIGEHDKDLVEKIMHDDKLRNPDRLRKLHQRFTHTTTKQQPLALEKPLNRDENEDHGVIFTDNQRFFYEFMVNNNTYQFTSQVAIVLQARLRNVLDTVTTLSIATLRKEFSVNVLHAKLLGKFLGWIHYSPSWSMPKLHHNAAMEAATQEAIQMRNQVQVPFDVGFYLEDSISKHTLMANIPWICDYLLMVAKDPIACQTNYFQALFSRLQQLYLSPRLNAKISENTWNIILQLETILKTETIRCAALDPSDGLHESCQGMDAITFLANDLFLQHCVKDIGNCRRFLQTLHNEDKNSTSRKVKLRPFVVQENALITTTSSPSSPKQLSTDTALTSAFYKQYPTLKPTIEFVVDTTMKNVCHFVNTTILQPAAVVFVERLHGELNLELTKDEQLQWLTTKARQQLPTAKALACKQAQQAAQPYCKHHIPLAMESLISPTIPSCVKNIAIDLATEKAITSLHSLVQTSLAMEYSKHVVVRIRKLKKETPIHTKLSVSSGIDRFLVLSSLVLSSPYEYYDEYISLLLVLPLTSTAWVCIYDTFPYLPLKNNLKFQKCIQKLLSNNNIYEISFLYQLLFISLQKNKIEETYQLILMLCNNVPKWCGDIQSILISLKISKELIQKLFQKFPLLFGTLNGKLLL